MVANDAAASNGQLVGYIGNGAANTLQFNNVSAANAGNYTLVLRYSNGEVSNGNSFQIIDRSADVSVNGATPLRVAFANTRGWSTFWTATLRVNLTAGNNTVKIGGMSGWAPNIDSLIVAPTSN